MASLSASKNVASKWSTFFESAKLYFSRHPIIGAYVIMNTVFVMDWMRRYYHVDKVFGPVHKYRRYNIVVRPEDPAAKFVKRGEIGIDRV